VAAVADSGGHILPNLMVFGEVLRRLGLEFGSNNMLDLVRAAQDNTIGIPIGRKQDFQHAARCLLVHRKQDLPLFDDAFKIFWRPPRHQPSGIAVDGRGTPVSPPTSWPGSRRFQWR
jgi:uncharacterized protein with von Willebrand factor type A (vWA) domain